VDLIASRFRGVLIAIVVLGLSAGAVFAGHVVLQAPATTPTASEQGDQSDDADATDNEAPDGTEDGSGNTADNHGALVSMAAQMDTPAGFANHGAFVSCVAQMKDVTDAATFDFSTVTVESCAAAAAADKAAKTDAVHGKAGQHGKGRGHKPS
jgi:hypothetical protein